MSEWEEREKEAKQKTNDKAASKIKETEVN